MILSIDYDETWTADPEAWRMFSRLLASRGHVVIVTTNRYDIPLARQGVHETIGTRAVKAVIFAGAKPKRLAALERGYHVDVWVDDLPEMVVYGRHVPNPDACECRDWGRPQARNGHHLRCPRARDGC